MAPPICLDEPHGLLVKFKEGTGLNRRQNALAHLAARVHHFENRNIGGNGRRGPRFFDELVYIDLKDNIGMQRALEALMRNNLVEYVEPNAAVSMVNTRSIR